MVMVMGNGNGTFTTYLIIIIIIMIMIMIMALRYTYTIYDIRLISFFFPTHFAVSLHLTSYVLRSKSKYCILILHIANIRYMHFIRYKSVINISIITKILQCVDTSLNIVILTLEPIKIKITSFVPVTVHVQLAMVQ
jgi:hypothetical protein